MTKLQQTTDDRTYRATDRRTNHRRNADVQVDRSPAPQTKISIEEFRVDYAVLSEHSQCFDIGVNLRFTPIINVAFHSSKYAFLDVGWL